MIDAQHWKTLRGMDPQDVVKRALVAYDETLPAYRLNLLSHGLVIRPDKEKVEWQEVSPETEKPPGFHHWLVSVVYLITAKNVPLSGKWVQATSLPYGEFFFRGPHELPAKQVAEAYGDRPEAFAGAAARMGGDRWQQGHNAFILPALPRVPILAQLWERDEEFPARASFLFDRDTCEHLPVDAVFSLAALVAKGLTMACAAQNS